MSDEKQKKEKLKEVFSEKEKYEKLPFESNERIDHEIITS